MKALKETIGWKQSQRERERCDVVLTNEKRAKHNVEASYSHHLHLHLTLDINKRYYEKVVQKADTKFGTGQYGMVVTKPRTIKEVQL